MNSSSNGRMTTARMVELYTLLRMALAQLAKFRQELHSLRQALSARRERALRGGQQGAEPAPAVLVDTCAPSAKEARVEPWHPMSLRMAVLALRLTTTIICHMRSGKMITEDLKQEGRILLIQIVGELTSARDLFRTTDHLQHLRAETHLDSAKEKAKRVVALLAPIRAELELRLDDYRPPKKKRRIEPTVSPPTLPQGATT